MTLASTEPAEPPAEPRPGSTWLSPRAQSHGVPRYIEALRAGRWIILASVVTCVGVAALYLAQASKVYEAEADVLVTPQDLTVPIPGIIRQSSDPTRDVETAARLATSPTVARRVKARLHLPGTSEQVLSNVDAQPIAQSNIVTITASAPSAGAAV